jgi:DNA-binding beta-propeller fold protein YncE
MLRALALSVLVTACTASANEVQQPIGDPGCVDGNGASCAAKFFWPTGMAISPDESVLFIANANSDLTYNSGTVFVLDLSTVEQALTPWAANRTLAQGCTQDADFAETMVCAETPYLRNGAAVRVGNFATAIGVQVKNAAGDLRLVVPTRGDPSITWMDWVTTGGGDRVLSCADDVTTIAGHDNGYPQCGPNHRLTHLRNDPNQANVADEPFDVFVDSTSQFAVVTHLTSGTASLVDLPIDGTPMISDAIGGLFGSDPVTGAIGASAVAGRDPTAPGDIVYVASHTESRVQTFTIARPKGQPALLDPGEFIFLNAAGNQAGGSRDARGLAFSPGGDRMYVLNREPPSVQLYDTSIGPQGAPKNEGIGSTDICRGASRLVLADTGDGERAYVACFDEGQVYVVDPRDGVQVTDVIAVGRGPYDIVASASKKRLYVSNYLENTLSVIDITPGSATRNRVLLRLGEPKKQ